MLLFFVVSALMLGLAAVSVSYSLKATVVETLPNNTGSAADAKRQITHDQYDVTGSMNGASSPAAVVVAEFVGTLSSGALTIDMRNLTGTNGAVVDCNGYKLQILRIKNLGANVMTFGTGASNGNDSIGTGVKVQPGGVVEILTNGNGTTVDGTHKTIDVAGTGSQTFQATVIAG